MDVSAISSVSLQEVSKAAIKTPGKEAGASFQSAISDLLKEANTQHVQADQSVQQLVTGQTDNVHDVVLSMAKADLSFRLLLEIRNKLMDSYQEIMRMQV
jgi:flagellar hook-basal body complex protein FliE